MPYIIILLLLILSIVLFDFLHLSRGRKLAIATIWIVLVLTAGLAYHLGVDGRNTEAFYYNPPDSMGDIVRDWRSYRFDIGYMILSYVLGKIFPSYVAMQLFVSCMLTTSVMLFFNRYARHFFTALTIYFIFTYIHFNIEVLRESLAISLILFAWQPLNKGRWITYFVLTGIAVSFHFTAAIALLFPLLGIPGVKKWFMPGWRLLLIAISCIGLSYLLIYVWTPLLNSLPDILTVRRLRYSYSSVIENGCALNYKGVAGYLIQFVIYPLIFSYLYKPGGVHKSIPGLVQLTCVGICLSLIGLILSPFSRFTDYFIIFTIAMMGSGSLSALPPEVGGIYFSKHRVVSLVAAGLMILPFFGLRLYTYKTTVGDEKGIPFYRLYYPYADYINPTSNQERELLVRKLLPYFHEDSPDPEK